MRILLLTIVAFLLAPLVGCTQLSPVAHIPHLERRRTATQLIVDGQPYLALAGEVRNSSSSSLTYMKPVWPKLAAAHLNTVLAPVSWEQLEPKEGQFDFTLVDGLIQDARQHDLRLAFLWFGTWKNLVSSYAAVWVRTHPERFACAVDQAGNRLPIVSTFSDATCQADARAFGALMRHVRQLEEAQPRKTVLMIQVQNEVGLGGGTRDYAPAANAAMSKPVPPELMDYLLAHKDTLYPDLAQLWVAAGAKGSGTWEQVFGTGPSTNEIFMSWNYARYIGKVVAAGKAEYPIPMFANASVGRQDGKTGTFPAGGPVAYVMDVWRAGAPQLDMISPDIYYGSFAGWCAKYTRSGNPLFIPEMRAGADGTINALTAIASYNAIGCSPFAIDDTAEADAEYRGTYDLLAQLAPLILEHQGTGTMALGVLDAQNASQKIPLGRYTLNLEAAVSRNSTTAPAGATTAPAPRAYALAIGVGADEYVVAGRNVQLTFSPNPPAQEVAAVAALDEGKFVRGEWIPGRRLNGNETMLSYALSPLAAGNQTGTGVRFGGDKPAIYRIKVVRYAGSGAAGAGSANTGRFPTPGLNGIPTPPTNSTGLVPTAQLSAGARVDEKFPQIRKTAHGLRLYVDGQPFIMLGGQVGNASGTPERMAAVWPKLKAYNANTVEIPVYWSRIEPEEGKYDFSVSDQVIRDCRAQGLRAVLLWFGSNKCGRPQNYPPRWVLSDTKRFPRIIDAAGNPAEPMALDAPATLEVERNACRVFMQHLKEIDGVDHTVILMQVENEPGLLGYARDYAPEATRLFNAAVPSALTTALHKPPGTWKEVFGPRLAEEAFSAYHLATYCNALSVAEKEAYPLPTYVNVWMGGEGTNDRFYDFDLPGSSYPSGGPVSHMLDLWKAAAPDIDVLAPDIYHRSAAIYRTILTRYTRPDNPLVIVETGQGMPFARYCFTALADFSAIGFAQYGVDQGGGNAALSGQFTDVGADFRLVRNALPVIAALQGSDKLKSAIEEEFISGRMLSFDGYDILVRFPPAMNRRPGSPEPVLPAYTPTGRALIAQTGPDEFLVLGFDSAIDFKPALGSGVNNAKFTQVEDGAYENGIWKATAKRDPGSSAGDLKLSAEGSMVRVRLSKL